ncbi:MAG TPA: cell division protein ZipA [Burkholderiales bacterium]|nr:cell division protein ZipA [Burkholderiales bacterium]
MDGLRWLLLLFGLLVVVGVYLYSRRERDKQREPLRPERPSRVEPSLNGASATSDVELQEEQYSVIDDADLDAESVPVTEPADPLTSPKQKIVTMRLVAKKHGAFAGDDLVLNLRGVGMRHGKFGIFHRYHGDDERKVIFSAASLIEPGSFDLENIKNQKIPGISLFMVLPGPLDGCKAFDLMMEAGRSVAKALHAELLDESGSTLSIQRERYLREEIIQYQHGIKVA